MANYQNNHIIIAEEIIISKIYHIRGRQVMLSHDLAELYEVETKVLNQQVKRNSGKFPEKYMFPSNSGSLCLFKNRRRIRFKR